jgi:hypothetical protein
MRLSTFALLVAISSSFAPSTADAAFCEFGGDCPFGLMGLLPPHYVDGSEVWNHVVYADQPVVFSISLFVSLPATSATTPIFFDFGGVPFYETGLYGSGFQYYLHGYFPDPGTAYMSGLFYDNLGTLTGIGAEGGGECCGAYYVTVLAADTPEPSTWAMLLIGFAAIGFAGYRKLSQRAVVAVGAVHVGKQVI